MKRILLLIAVLCSWTAQAKQAHLCEADALEHAKALLTLHVGEDDRMDIDSDVDVLPSIKNPANPKQKFDVLQVHATIYKGQYRMRFIYYLMPESRQCLLMGQEVLELADI